MKVLLVYPKYPSTFWSFDTILNFVKKKSAYPPLGLLTVASLLPKKWEKKLVDCNVSELKDSDIEWADYVFLSAMLVQKEESQKVINKCNKLGVKVVAGGPAFTTSHKEFKRVNHFVLNEAEETLPMFLKDLKKGKLKKIYISMKRPDITKTPTPMWSLINVNDYSTMPIQYSRGCPFNCEFCDIIIMNGRVPRTKTGKQIVKELKAVYDTGWRGGVFIVDDNFIGNKVNVKKMLPLVIKWQEEHDYPFQLTTEASTNLADDEELMDLMIKANFNSVFLGIETPDADSLTECGKVQNKNRDLVETVKKIHKKGIKVMGGFIVGFDSDKENIFDRQIKFIQQSGVVTAMVGILNALPETRLWKRLKKEGRIIKQTTGENTDGHINFIPKMGKEKLIKGYKKIISTIYSPKEYYTRIRQFVKDYEPKVKSKLSLEGLNAFLKSVWEIGIKSKSRLYYWRLILETYFTKIKAFPAAVELAIQGLHYERITKRIVEMT